MNELLTKEDVENWCKCHGYLLSPTPPCVFNWKKIKLHNGFNNCEWCKSPLHYWFGHERKTKCEIECPCENKGNYCNEECHDDDCSIVNK